LSDQRASLLLRRLPRPRPFTLFPYTTLFRSPALIGRGSERSDHCCGDMPKLIDPIIHLRGVMDIRSLQKPLKEKYRRDPSSSRIDRKSTRLNSSHLGISYAVFCLKKKLTG